MKKVFKKIATISLMAIVVLMMAAPTFAAASPYSDISKRGIGEYAYKSIRYIKNHKGFKGVIKGKNYYPRKFTTRKEFLKVLVNLYGKKYVPITATDKKKYNKRINPKWIRKKLNAVAKKLGGPTREVSDLLNVPVTRDGMAVYIYEFCHLNKKFKPRK